MANRNINNNKKSMPASIIDGRKFLDMLSTISLEEVLNLEFRRLQHEKWLKMITLDDDKNKKLYHCNVCNVVQYGDKNLFSHLSGKRHNANMESVRQLTLNNMKNQFNKNINPKTGPPNQSSTKPTPKPSPQATPKPSSQATPKPSSQATAAKISEKPSSQASAAAAAETKSNATSANNSINTKPVEVTNKNASITEKTLTASTPDVKEAKNSNSGANKTGSSSISSKPKVNESQQKPSESNSSGSKSGAVNQSQIKPTNIATKPKNNNTSNNNNKKPTDTKISEKDSSNSSSNKKNMLGNGLVVNPLNPKTQTATNKQSGNSEDKTRDSKTNRGEKIPEIVKNPLAGADASKTVITCVPIAKLLSIKSDNEETTTDQIEVISLDDTDPEPPSDTRKVAEELPSTSQGRSDKTSKSRSERNERNRVLIPAITSGSGQSKSTGERQVAVFESKPNPNEIVGVLGVEYVIKIVRTLNDRNPRYQCSLCDVTTDQAAMQCHLVGYNHMLKYCEKHFPSAMAQYRQFMVNVPEHKVCKVLVPILRKLAIAVEKHHGRGSAFLCYDYTYQKNKATIVAKALNRKHSSELIGPSFIHVVDAKEVDALIANANKRVVQEPQPAPADYVINTDPHFIHTHYPGPPYYNPNSSIPTNNYNIVPEQNSTEMMVDDETHKRMVENFLRDNKHGQSQERRSQHRSSKRHRSRSTSLERKRRRSMSSQWNVERRSLSPLREGDIWQAYRHMVDQKVRELNVFFELYKGDPEEHPQYQDEWQKFWKRRKDELIAAGINHRTYNYQNEWVLFFNARIEELYNQDVENIKIKCRERLCLPMTNDNLPNPKYHVHSSQILPEMVSPVEEKQDEEEDDDIPNVIHVLRLLTAMEDNLGSLGPHITEMLAKALQTQKVHPDKLNSLILTHENCAILETAKEKFTGLVISKILDATKERAIKRAINDTNLLLKSVPRMIRKSPNNDMNLRRASEDLHINLRKQSQADISDNRKSPSSSSHVRPIQIESSMDKTELAAKLASTITSQGKTSINREQLQQIIQVYSMIEKKKRLESSANNVETFNNSGNNQRSDLTEKPNNNNDNNQPTPVVNYQDRMTYDNTVRNMHNSAPQPYQGLLRAPNYYGNNNSNAAPSEGSIYGSSNVMNNFPASGNYLSANVARMNNTNYNNSNIMSNYGNNHNQQEVGSNSYNPYQKTDGGGQFSMNPPNSMRSNPDMPPYYNSSNAYNNNFGSKRIP